MVRIPQALAVLCALALPAIPPPAGAQERIPSHCVALADAAPGIGYLHRAAFGDALPADSARLTFVAHATFVLETPGGITVATDYTGNTGPLAVTPMVVTMNNAHGTHWTARPDPAITHVLRGWSEGGEPADHYLDLGEMLIRNVPTDVRAGGDTARIDGNSIFVFEVAGLCVGHLGHLHQELSPEQYATLGRLDVVMAPVDGGYTLDLDSMINVLKRLRASVVIPMHWFNESALMRFREGMQGEFDVVDAGASSLDLSLAMLPQRPTVMVLRPAGF